MPERACMLEITGSTGTSGVGPCTAKQDMDRLQCRSKIRQQW